MLVNFHQNQKKRLIYRNMMLLTVFYSKILWNFNNSVLVTTNLLLSPPLLEIFVPVLHTHVWDCDRLGTALEQGLWLQCESRCCVYMQRALRGWRGSASVSGLAALNRLTSDLWVLKQLVIKQQKQIKPLTARNLLLLSKLKANEMQNKGVFMEIISSNDHEKPSVMESVSAWQAAANL